MTFAAGSRMTKDQLTLHAPEVTDLTDANIRRVDDEHLLHFCKLLTLSTHICQEYSTGGWTMNALFPDTL